MHRLADLAGGPFDVISGSSSAASISAESATSPSSRVAGKTPSSSRASSRPSSAEIHEARSLTALATSSAAGASGPGGSSRRGSGRARVEENPAAGVGCLERLLQAWGGTARARRGARADACPCTTPGRSGGHGPALRRRRVERECLGVELCALDLPRRIEATCLEPPLLGPDAASTGGARDRRPARPCCMTTSRGSRGATIGLETLRGVHCHESQNVVGDLGDTGVLGVGSPAVRSSSERTRAQPAAAARGECPRLLHELRDVGRGQASVPAREAVSISRVRCTASRTRRASDCASEAGGGRVARRTRSQPTLGSTSSQIGSRAARAARRGGRSPRRHRRIAERSVATRDCVCGVVDRCEEVREVLDLLAREEPATTLDAVRDLLAAEGRLVNVETGTTRKEDRDVTEGGRARRWFLRRAPASLRRRRGGSCRR